jgi:hypothetical protein
LTSNLENAGMAASLLAASRARNPADVGGLVRAPFLWALNMALKILEISYFLIGISQFFIITT